MQRLIDAAKFASSKLQRTGSASLLIAKAQLDTAISEAERKAADEKSELEQLRAENKKLRDVLQELLDFSDSLQGRYYARSMQARINAGALLNPEASSKNQT